jgi:putative glutamine amidotransferase
MVETTLDNHRPVFGVCRGFQELNVAFGGTLRRDVSAEGRALPHHAASDVKFDDMFKHEHAVTLVPGGVLQSAYQRESLEVNSVHYQGANKLGQGLRVEAHAPDGLVEAFSASVNGAPVLAVQWHPEWQTNDNEDSQTFFALLGRALRGEKLEGLVAGPIPKKA